MTTIINKGGYFVSVTAEGFWEVAARGANGKTRLVLVTADWRTAARAQQALAATLN